MEAEEPQEPQKSPLDAIHRELGARMVPFAGWEMPLHYAPGILKEHLHCREKAALFDVSHMGPMLVYPKGGPLEDVKEALERIMPVDVMDLEPGRQRYGFLTTPDGGILDDLMFANRGDHFYLVVNAGNFLEVNEWIANGVAPRCLAGPLVERAMIALQGPKAEEVLGNIAPEVAEMRFLDVREMKIGDIVCVVTRSGYSGEDGFEISIPVAHAERMVRFLLTHPLVEPAGLGARDSLRIEAGLCLYGNDIDTSTSPVEAGLSWAIQKVRRGGGARAGDFPGAERILEELEAGPSRRLVGLRPEGQAPVRAGATLHAEPGGPAIGNVTSGVYSPTLGAPVAMGYVAPNLAKPGTVIQAEVRGRPRPVTVTKMPFIKAGYKR